MSVSDVSIARAVEITKSAIGSDNATWIGHGETVAKFIEAVAKKLEELRSESH